MSSVISCGLRRRTRRLIVNTKKLFAPKAWWSNNPLIINIILFATFDTHTRTYTYIYICNYIYIIYILSVYSFIQQISIISCISLPKSPIYVAQHDWIKTRKCSVSLACHQNTAICDVETGWRTWQHGSQLRCEDQSICPILVVLAQEADEPGSSQDMYTCVWGY